MITALDTNVPSRLLGGGRDGLIAQGLLREARMVGGLSICAIVYAELLAKPEAREEHIRRFLQEAEVQIDFSMPQKVWVEAGLRFGAYAERRRRSGGGEARRLLADFVVGAHALLQADRLLTFDTKRYQTAFPELVLFGEPAP